MKIDNKTILLAAVLVFGMGTCLSFVTKDLANQRESDVYEKCIKLHSPELCK